jgi:predicted nucleic-acid-binding protein
MTITADTNVLVRVVVHDDPGQAKAAEKALKEAEMVVLTLACLCEVGWALRSVYGIERGDIADTIERLCSADNVIVNESAVDAGLKVLRSGGDFADAVIAFEGAWLGGETFVSFDKKAVAAIEKLGLKAKLLK